MKKKRNPSKPQFKAVVIDFPPNVLRDLRREAAQLREHGVKASMAYLIKQRLAAALAAGTYQEVMEQVKVTQAP